MESIKELNQICQKPDYRKVGSLIDRYIVRDFAIYVTWLLLHTHVSANQVTLTSLVIGLVGAFLLAFESGVVFVAAMLFLFMWYVLDKADGQIARYRKTMGCTGLFFDYVMHNLIHGAVFFSLGFFLFNQTGASFFVIWGFVIAASIMTFNMIDEIKYATFFIKLALFKSLRTVEYHEVDEEKSGPKNRQVLRTAFSVLHKACEIHVLLTILFVAAMAQALFKIGFDLRTPLTFFYGIVVPVITCAKITYIIKTGKVDQDFENTFQIHQSSVDSTSTKE